MSFLANFLSSEPSQSIQTPNETIEKLCERIQHSAMLEDRRGSVLGLKGLAKDYKLLVGTKGMAGLLTVLTNDRMDVDIINATLETLNILCSTDTKGKKKDQDEELSSEDLGVMFTEIYVKNPGNVTLLLDILEETDFYIRYHTVEFLCTLLRNMGEKLQECVLTSPLGISRLIDLLDDRREIIRNESLLLLISLTKSNAEIQKIIAFENAFERLLTLIVNEGATDGGIVVHDCLQLLQNLLRHNASNQNFFRENSCITQISHLLVKSVEGGSVELTHETNDWTDDQKVRNTVAVLELIRTLVSPNSPSTLNVINRSLLINPIVNLAMSNLIPDAVRSHALLSIGDIIRGNKSGQDDVSIMTLPVSSIPRKVLPPNDDGSVERAMVLSIVKLCLVREAGFAVRSGAAYVLQCMVHDNPEMQLSIAGTFLEGAGALVVAALLDWDAGTTRKDPFTVWFASVIMCAVVEGNVDIKDIVLGLGVDGEDGVGLLHRVMYQLSVSVRENPGPDVRVLIGMLCFVSMWLYEYPRGVREFFCEAGNLQFVTEQIIQDSGVELVVQGLSAYLLGLCVVFNEDEEGSFGRDGVQSLIISRIGAGVFVGRIERLRESRMVREAGRDEEGMIDFKFIEMFKASSDGITRAAVDVGVKKSPKKEKSSGDIAKDLRIGELEVIVDELRSELRELGAELGGVVEGQRLRIQELETSQQAAGGTVVRDDVEGRLRDMEAEQEDLLVCLAEGDMEVKKLKDMLRAYGEEFDDSGDEEGSEGDGEGGAFL